MTREEAIARSVMAAEYQGHNDPPMFDVLDDMQKGYRMADAHVTIRALELCGYQLTQR